MASLEEKFQRLLSIRTRILELVQEADTLVPQGGHLILSDLSSVQTDVPIAQSRAVPATTVVSGLNQPTASHTAPVSGKPEKPEREEEETRSHPYTPRPQGSLKGKSLTVAVEEVMKTHFTQVPGVNRQIMAILADEGFDGFAAYSLNDPMELVRNTLSAHPNVDRPTKKTYIWVPRENKPDDSTSQAGNPTTPLPSIPGPQEGTAPESESTLHSDPKTTPSPETTGDSEDVTFLDLVPQATGAETPDNGDEEL
jgi:hypothetical protein